MTKKEKRVDNPLFENTIQKAVMTEVQESAAEKQKCAVETPAPKPPRREPEPKAEQKSIEDLRKMKDEIKNRLASIEKESDNIENLSRRFVGGNARPDEVVENIKAESDLVAEWGVANEPRVENPKKGEGGRSDIFQVIRDLENEIESKSALNNSLQMELSDSRRELKKLRGTGDEQAKKIRSLEDASRLSEELLEKLAISEEEKNKAVKRKQDIESELEFIISEKRTLEGEMHDLKMKVKELEKQNGNLTGDVNVLREKNNLLEEIHNDLSYTVAQKDKKLERVDSLEAELEALTTTRDALELDLRTARNMIAHFKSEKEAVETRLAYLEENKTQIESKLAAAVEENRKSNERVQELARELGATRALKNNLEAECGILKKTLEEIHGALVCTRHRTAHKSGVEKSNE
jgi:predicted  nucleic acid-binding Zn-ribbon protein